jgi:subtilase family serine protease
MSGNGYDMATWLVCDDDTNYLAFTNSQGLLNCSNISGGYFDGFGGTSTAAPAFAGILALVQQKTGNRLGQAAQSL